jgi:hypothetical protein
MKMVLSKAFFCSLILFSNACICQQAKEVDVTDVFKANFFDPGISYEKRLGFSQTLYGQAFLSTSIYIGYSSALGNLSSVDIYPALTLQYRYYYNGDKRANKGKGTALNSMNYLTIVAEADFYTDRSWDQDVSRVLKTFGTAWGFQRNYPKRFSLDFNIGVGYAFSKKTVMSLPGEYTSISFADFTTLGQISLGFWLNKRK